MVETNELEDGDKMIIKLGDSSFKIWNSGGELLIRPEDANGLYFTGFRPTSRVIESHIMTYMRIRTVKDIVLTSIADSYKEEFKSNRLTTNFKSISDILAVLHSK